MANTPIYGFQTPDDTDLVKDGALAIRTALDDVDATLATALNSKDYAGLSLIKTQTIGTAVSTVTVTDAFSADYPSYKIIVVGGVMAAENIFNIRMGATATGYYGSLTGTAFSTSAAVNAGYSNATGLFIGAGSTGAINANVEVHAPFLTKPTIINSTWSRILTNGYAANLNGFLNDTTSYTDFALVTSSSFTGGTIYVYGYGAS